MASKSSSLFIYGFLLVMIFLYYFFPYCLAARILEDFPQNDSMSQDKDDHHSKTDVHPSQSDHAGSATGDDTPNGPVDMPPPAPYERTVDHYNQKENSTTKTNNGDGSESEVTTSNNRSGYSAHVNTGNKGQTITSDTRNQTVIEKNHQNSGNIGGNGWNTNNPGGNGWNTNNPAGNGWNTNNPAYSNPPYGQQYPVFPPPMYVDPNLPSTIP